MKYILFIINNKQYAIEISQVSEVIKIEEFSLLPDAPDFLAGIIDLRGEIIPLINLKVKFGLERQEKENVEKAIIAATDACDFGIIVDSVLGVKNMETIEVSASDALMKEIKYLECIGKNGEALVPVLNVKKLLNDNEKAKAERVCQQVSAN